MTRQEFEHYQAILFSKCADIATAKGNEYSGLEDAHMNFKRLGHKLGLPPEKVLMVYLTKHMDSIDSFIRSGLDSSHLTEPIEGRIIDAITYLSLLAALIETGED